MKKIFLKNICLENFKGCKERMVEFGNHTTVSGANATGKTTIFDAAMWTLFNKDSLGNTKFDIRPLENGKMIDNVEIKVELTLEVDGVEYILSKVQKQKWVKKRGADTREFQGNVNEFEINGYPKSEKEFKEFVAGIVDEKLFSLLTNPNTFNAMPWKEQRETLMQFVGRISDEEIANGFGDKFAILLSELKLASTDDIHKKYTKAKNSLNKQMIEIPARIDEVSKQLVQIDVGALEVEKAAKQAHLKKVEDVLSGKGKNYDEVAKVREEIMERKFEISEIQNRANQELDAEKMEAKSYRDKLLDVVRNTRKKISDLEYQICSYERSRDSAERDKQRYADAWRAEKAKAFPEYTPLEPLTTEDLKCPTCGQELPVETRNNRIADYKARCVAHEEKYKKEKAVFQNEHRAKLLSITNNGQLAADDVRKYQKLADETKAQLDQLKATLEKESAEHKKACIAVDEIPMIADVSKYEAVKETKKKIAELEIKLDELNNDDDKEKIQAQKDSILSEIADLDRKIAAADNSRVMARIAELEEEKADIGQRIAHQEQMIDLVEEFIRCKMDKISQLINQKFKTVSFKLFDMQINGGLKETCECTVNGVPYGSLNNGHRIIAGLDIISSLSNLYDITCPVFVDNAEAISEGNFPDMRSQVILLEVTDSKELKVEVS